MNETIDSRTTLLIGEEAVKTLKDKTVAVFGLGGVGGTAFESLVRAGVGHIYAVDRDVVAEIRGAVQARVEPRVCRLFLLVSRLHAKAAPGHHERDDDDDDSEYHHRDSDVAPSHRDRRSRSRTR